VSVKVEVGVSVPLARIPPETEMFPILAVWALKSRVPSETVVVPEYEVVVKTHFPAPDLVIVPVLVRDAEIVLAVVAVPFKVNPVPAKPVNAV
jgi:hypothetical protein